VSNSIIDNLTKEDFKASLDLMLSADIEKQKVIILVEGIDDVKFVNGMNFNKENIIVEQSYSGKQGIREIMKFYQQEKRIIAIRDRDYEMENKDKKVFYYDYCCLEMMMLSMDDVFECIYYEYILEKRYKRDILKVRYDLLKQLKYISLTRKINEEKKLGINFTRININSIFSHKNINIIKFKEEVNERCNNFFKMNFNIEREIDNQYKNEMDLEELLNITNGHDFCQLFAKLANKDRKKGISKDIIESNLRCSFKKENFEKTKLYQKLINYQKNERISILNTKSLQD